MTDKYAGSTPGPWYAGQLRKYELRCDIEAENGANVAIVLHHATDRKRAETLANARLIADAWLIPQLVEMLRDMVDMDEGDSPIAWPYEMRFDRARALLAKIDGKAKP